MPVTKKEAEKKPAQAKPKAQAPATREEKGIAKPSDADAIRAKARAASQLAAGNTSAAQTLNYLSLCQAMTKAKKKAYPDLYIQGLQDGEFFLQQKKLNLGTEVRFVPLAFFEIYQEFVTDPQVNKDAKMVGKWLVEDAEQLDTQYGKQWNRETLDGHILCKAWEIYGYLPDFPEEERVVITFKSTGNKVARAWFKDASKRAPDAPFSLIYTLTSEDEVSGSNSWLKIVPTFDSFVYTIDKDGDIDKINEDFAEAVIDRAGAINRAFATGRLIQKHTVKDAPNPRHASRDEYEGDEGTNPDF